MQWRWAWGTQPRWGGRWAGVPTQWRGAGRNPDTPPGATTQGSSRATGAFHGQLEYTNCSRNQEWRTHPGQTLGRHSSGLGTLLAVAPGPAAGSGHPSHICEAMGPLLVGRPHARLLPPLPSQPGSSRHVSQTRFPWRPHPQGRGAPGVLAGWRLNLPASGSPTSAVLGQGQCRNPSLPCVWWRVMVPLGTLQGSLLVCEAVSSAVGPSVHFPGTADAAFPLGRREALGVPGALCTHQRCYLIEHEGSPLPLWPPFCPQITEAQGGTRWTPDHQDRVEHRGG